MFKKALRFVPLLFAMCLSGCGSSHVCSYCGGKAVWKAQETFLGEPMGSPVYVCADCKRDGKGPHATVTGNTITWTHL